MAIEKLDPINRIIGGGDILEKINELIEASNRQDRMFSDLLTNNNCGGISSGIFYRDDLKAIGYYK